MSDAIDTAVEMDTVVEEGIPERGVDVKGKEKETRGAERIGWECVPKGKARRKTRGRS